MKTSSVSSSPAGLSPVHGGVARAERVRRIVETSDRFDAEVGMRHGGYGRFEPRWSSPVVDDPKTMAQMTQPRGAFLAQLIAQEDRLAAADDRSLPVGAYRRASLKLVEIRAGATVDLAA